MTTKLLNNDIFYGILWKPFTTLAPLHLGFDGNDPNQKCDVRKQMDSSSWSLFHEGGKWLGMELQ